MTSKLIGLADDTQTAGIHKTEVESGVEQVTDALRNGLSRPFLATEVVPGIH